MLGVLLSLALLAIFVFLWLIGLIIWVIIQFWWLILLAGIIALIKLMVDAVIPPYDVRRLTTRRLYGYMFLSYISTLGIGIGITYLLFYAFNLWDIFSWIVLFVGILIFIQWFFGPPLINFAMDCRPMSQEYGWLVDEIERIAEESGVKPPKVMISNIDVPNAFAYGNPIFGNYVAFTKGILKLLPRDELIAVGGHEIGHIKHRDVHIIISLMLFPMILYFTGRILLENAFYVRSYGKGEGEAEGILGSIIIGIIFIAISFVIYGMVMFFNRLREYYADAHSAYVTKKPILLQRALTRLYLYYRHAKKRKKRTVAFTMLMTINPIAGKKTKEEIDPSTIPEEEINRKIEELKKKKTEPEFFDSHPPVPYRLIFLDNIAKEIS